MISKRKKFLMNVFFSKNKPKSLIQQTLTHKFYADIIHYNKVILQYEKNSFRYAFRNLKSALILITFLLSTAIAQESKESAFQENVPYRLDFKEAKINKATTEQVRDSRLTNEIGLTLKESVSQAINGEREEPDIVFTIKPPKEGQYLVQTFAVTDDEGAAMMKVAKTKFESMFMNMQFGSARPSKRVIYVPWDRPNQRTGIFQLTEQEQELKIWLPRGVRLGHVEIRTYNPPAVPAAAVNYTPTVVPPKSHPRLWVNQETLPSIRQNLSKAENKDIWEKLKKEAMEPYNYQFDPTKDILYDANVELAAQKKAFYYLMTGDQSIGREAVDLMISYMTNVEFGNILDITREIGRAIYNASLVYDWAYDLLSAREKEILRSNLMRLAVDMEIGWPPFRTKILNGHGAEAIVNRDFLSMAIALYNEDPLPYQYVSYAILEELIPMRRFEYQSPRHNQGVNYGAYRFSWEMHNAWLMRRMAGKEVFHENMKSVPEYWLYMRTPNGQMLRDGDGFGAGKADDFYYWKHPLSMFLMYTYANDPVLKGEFLRHGGIPTEPVLFLLLNNPDLKPEPSLASLPLTKDFGPILGSMVARTGWDISPESDDVVVEIKGGGYHFGNHQQSDAGSMQIYYRGFQLGDIGLYRFYGTPYDMGFNKRSISHSMMLVLDPEEKFDRSEANDGGTRFNQRAPISPSQVQSDEWFHVGKVLSTSYGPSTLRPHYSYFSVDLAAAYADKVTDYVRSFCFLNLDRKDIPAVVILKDHIRSKNPNFKKYWQINSLNKPEVTAQGFILSNSYKGRTGKTHIHMLYPADADRTTKILSGEEANSAFNMQFEAPESPHPEGRANRTMVSPKNNNKEDQFLSVFQIVDGQMQPLDIIHEQTEVSDVIHIADRVVSINRTGNDIAVAFSVNVLNDTISKVLLCGLSPGKWVIEDENDHIQEIDVKLGDNTIFFEATKGNYKIRPF